MRTPQPVFVAFLAAALPVLPGCVFWEIRDELTTTNRLLQDLERLRDTLNTLEQRSIAQLGQANTILAEVNTRLEEVNTNLTKVESRLTQAHIRLESLESIDRSLRSLDEQLLAVKSLVESLGSVMSLFGSAKEEPPPAETPAEGAAEPAIADPAAPTEATHPTPPER